MVSETRKQSMPWMETDYKYHSKETHFVTQLIRTLSGFLKGLSWPLPCFCLHLKTWLTLSSQAHNANSPNHSRRNWLSDVVRNDCSINFHLSKLSIAKFSILYDISLVRDWKRKLKLITPGSERVKEGTLFSQLSSEQTIYCQILHTVHDITSGERLKEKIKVDHSSEWVRVN